MATIAKMVIAGIVDPHGVKRGLAEALGDLQRFKKLASQRINMELAFPDLKKAEAAQKLLGNLTRIFNQEMAQAREGLFKGAIDTRAFKQSAQQSAKDFNTALLAGIDQLRSQKLISPAIHQALVSQLKQAGLDGGAALGKAAQRAVAAHPLLGNLTTTGQRAANTLLNGLNATYQQRINDLREQFANKLITVQQFRRKGQEAANEFDKGINSGLAQLRSKNQATDKITQALIDSYKLAGIKAANQFQFSLSKQMGENVGSVGRTFTAAITVPVVAAGIAAVKMGADFELSMNRIRAILQPTEDDMARMAAQARKIGAETQFSSRDAAEAQARLAQQTHSVALTMSAMPAVTRLAAASLTDMTSAADISTKILFGFGLKIEQLPGAIDQLVLLSNIARTNIQELGEAFKFVGPNAVRAKQDFSTISAALGTLAQRGLPASLGGTALRGILISLISPTKKAAQALKDLKIEVFDSSGKVKDLITLVKEFERAQRQASSQRGFEERLNAIFKTRAGTGFATILQAGSEQLESMKKKLEEAGGTAKRVADVQMSGATGSFREFQSAVEELALTFSDAGLLKGITEMTRSITNMVRTLKDVNPDLLRFVTYTLAFGAAVGPALIGIGKMITQFATLRAILVALNGPAALAGLAASLAVGGAVIVGIALLVALLYKVAAGAANARAQLEQFRGSLEGQGVEQLEALRKDIVASIEFNRAAYKMLKQRLKDDPRFNIQETLKGPNSALDVTGKLIERQLEMLRDTDRALVKARKSAAELAAAGDIKVDLPQEGGELDLEIDEGKVEKTKTAFEQLAERIKLIIQFTELLDHRIANQPKLVDELAKAWHRVNFFILQAGTSLDESTAELLEMRNRLQDVFKNVDVILPTMTEAEFRRAIGADRPLRLQIVPVIDVTLVKVRSPLEKAVEEFEKAANNALSRKLDLDLLGRAKNLSGVKSAARTYGAALSTAKTAEQNLSKVVLASNLPLAQKEELLSKIAEAMDRLDGKGKKTGEKFERFATSLQGIADAVRGLRSIAEAFGEIDEQAGNALDAIADVASSLGNFARSLGTGDMFGAIASAIGALGGLVKLGQSIFGKSDAEKKREAIYRGNTAAMEELKRSIDAWSVNVSNIGKAQPVISATIDLVQNFIQTVLEKMGKNLDPKNIQFKSVEDLDRKLRSAGSSFEELKAIAKELNVDILNEKGRLSAQGLVDLSKAMELYKVKLTQFGKSLDDERKRFELRRNVLNLDTSPVAQLQDNIDLLLKFAPGLGALFSGFDEATATGRAAIEKALQNLFLMLEAKLVDPKLFGTLSMEQLAGIIGDMATALDTFRESAENATKDMVNVPAGFKIERFRFEAMLTKAANATQQYADRVAFADAPIPSTQPIQRLLNSLTDMIPKVDALPDLQPLSGFVNRMATATTTTTTELDQFARALREATAATLNVPVSAAAATTSPAATVIVRDTRPVTPEPIPSGGNMTLNIFANVQQTQDPEDWYSGVKAVAKRRVLAKYGQTAVTRVEETMP